MLKITEQEIDQMVELQVDEILNNLEFKECTKCKESKILNGDNFYKKSSGRGGNFEGECKECRKAKVNEYKLNNLEKVKQKKKLDYETHKEFYTDKQAVYYYENRDEILEKRKVERDNKVEMYRDYRQTRKGKFKTYKDAAHSRGINWQLTFDEFCDFWQQPCYYCNSKILTIGLDRFNNEKIYSVETVVPCCTNCNRAKLAMSASDYIKLCKNVAKFHKEKRKKG